jgi:hypothetical protein
VVTRPVRYDHLMAGIDAAGNKICALTFAAGRS